MLHSLGALPQDDARKERHDPYDAQAPEAAKAANPTYRTARCSEGEARLAQRAVAQSRRRQHLLSYRADSFSGPAIHITPCWDILPTDPLAIGMKDDHLSLWAYRVKCGSGDDHRCGCFRIADFSGVIAVPGEMTLPDDLPGPDACLDAVLWRRSTLD